MVLLSGCASMGLAPEATSAEKRAAACQDAQTAYLMSVAMLEGLVPGESRAYWEAYKAGAVIGLQAMCPTQTSLVASK